jgi:hypothetical protein
VLELTKPSKRLLKGLRAKLLGAGCSRSIDQIAALPFELLGIAMNIIDRSVYIEVDRIEAWPGNPYYHPTENIFNLAQSFITYGQVKSIVIWPIPGQPEGPGLKFWVIAGNGFFMAVKEAGAEGLLCDIIDPATALEEVEGYAIADNQKGAIEQYIALGRIVSRQIARGNNTRALGYDQKGIQALLRRAAQAEQAEEDGPALDGPSKPRRYAPATPERVSLGDIWNLGKHKIFCWDSMAQAQAPGIKYFLEGFEIDLANLDPPYGIDLLGPTGGRLGKKWYNEILGDKEAFDPRPFLEVGRYQIFWGAQHYANGLPNSPCWFIWDKQGGVKDTTFASCELAWCSDFQPARLITHIWDGWRRDSENGIERYHPNQKPIAVVIWTWTWLPPEIKNVYSPFLGAGSDLFAAEQTGRVCRGVDLDPKHLDTTIFRFEQMTGQTAELDHNIDTGVRGPGYSGK